MPAPLQIREGEQGSWIAPPNLLKLVQVLSILIAAVWSLYLFQRFGESERELSLALMRNQHSQSALDAELSRLQIQASEMGIKRSQSAQISFEQEIEAKVIGLESESGGCLYLVSHRYSILNTGDSRHEVTYVAISAFLGSVPTPLPGAAIEVRCFELKSAMAWQPVFSRGFYYGAKWNQDLAFSACTGKQTGFERGGGGTSELDPGEVSEGNVDLILVGHPNDLVGFETRIGIDEGKSPENRWRLKNTALLPPTESWTGSGVGGANGG